MKRAETTWLRALVSAAAMLVLLSASAEAATPVAVGPGGPGGDLPLTAAQRQNVAQKEARARLEEARPGLSVRGGAAGGVAQAACPALAGGMAPATSCGTYWGYLVTYPRRQVKSYYCGVATVQVISNYAWNMDASHDRYSQQYISDAWTNTDANGQTTAWYEAVGLQGATAGSPRLPANFTYYYKRESSGSGWHADLRTDIGYFSMPMAASVAPKDPGYGYVLATWSSPSITAQYAGHWIVLTGWNGAWDGTAVPTVNFDDSAVGAAGSTGTQSAYSMWQIINKANPNHAAGYVVW